MTATDSAAQRGLDWHNFFVANVQTGFGPFLAVYLTAQAWTQAEIGAALSVGTIAFMVSQVPSGALVDAMPRKRLAAFAGCVGILQSALMLAIAPTWPSVLGAEVLHGFASCVLVAAIAAMSLGLVGRTKLGERLGRNARYAALGSGLAAAVMGAVGSWVSERAVFYLTAALMLPAIAALKPIRGRAAIAPAAAAKIGRLEALRVMLQWRVLVFAAAVVLFHLGNAAMLPLVATEVTKSLGNRASLVIAACIVLPQLLVGAFSPFVGRAAERWGRRPVLILSFLAVPVRGFLLAFVGSPAALVAVQMLDGISASGFGVMMPLIASDLTRGTNRFNLCVGLFGLAAGLGATVSTSLAGGMAEQYGSATALMALAVAGFASVLLLFLGFRETRLAHAEATASG